MLITSLDNDRIKSYIKLKDRKYRKKTKTFIVEGMHLVLEAYKSGNLIELILEKDEVLPIDVPTIYVTNEIINKISSLDNPSKVMGLCKMNDNKKVSIYNYFLIKCCISSGMTIDISTSPEGFPPTLPESYHGV